MSGFREPPIEKAGHCRKTLRYAAFLAEEETMELSR